MGPTAAHNGDWPDSGPPRCERATGSLGSDLLALRGGDPLALQGAIDTLSEAFRKSWRDLEQRIAVFMAPSRPHEFAKVDMRQLVEALCLAADDLPVVNMSSATAQAEGRTRSIEPDESFLIGARAVRFLRIESNEGREAALDDLGAQPPDLAIEVEHTHYDAGKPDLCRAVGVLELWELAAGTGRRPSRILHLQAPGGIREIKESLLVPGAQAAHLPAAAAELRRIGGLAQFAMGMTGDKPVVQRLLAAASGEAVPSVSGAAPKLRPKPD